MLKIVVCGLLLLACMADQVQSKLFTSHQMFSQVINDLPDDNVIVCPPAINMALTQLYLAAGGATATALKTDLAIKETPKGNVYKKPLPPWASLENPRIRIAGRLFAHTSIPIKPTYENTHAKYLETEIKKLDNSQETLAIINKWVISETDPDLEDLMDWIDDDFESIFLTSAVTYSDSWKYPFKTINDSMFYVSDESRAESVKMMQVLGSFKYSFQSSMDCHMVILPFLKSNIDMVLLIPRNFYEIHKIENGLKNINFNKAEVRKVNISLPVFKFRYSRDMLQTLMDIGIDKNVFAKTNLSDLITNNKIAASIESMMHSTIINVDTEGVKSAFGTGSILS
ncbi:hypothetical protein KR032_004990 [Drosophila birchii]|nr:hypothetical protein KR032_004990 [Drosophila birchii]